MKELNTALVVTLLLGLLVQCSTTPLDRDLSHLPYTPEPYEVKVPEGFPRLEVPEDNPITKAGVALGQKLFFDPILSADSTMSCVNCHLPYFALTDVEATSVGIDGLRGRRSSMSLLNVAFYNTGLFWDGRSPSLEAQALEPVEDTLELHHKWVDLVPQLREHAEYPALFRAAFGIQNTAEINKELAAKAIAQFERVQISDGRAKFDRVMQGEATFTPDEAAGYDMFFDVTNEFPDAECGHCHNVPLFTTNEYFNNGITAAATPEDFPDPGLGGVTGNPYDMGKFRAPSLRNITLTAPYMHDGRFKTLSEVLDHYNQGGQTSANVSPLIRPLKLSEVEKRQIIAFLHTLTDRKFVNHRR